MTRIATGLILFITSINVYLISMVFGRIPVLNMAIDHYTMRTWFCGSVVLMVLFIILALYSNSNENGKFECIIISLISIGATQLTVWLNGLHLINKPYQFLLFFDICNIIAFLTIFNYLSLINNGRNSNTGD